MIDCFSFAEILEIVESDEQRISSLKEHIQGGCLFCEKKLQDAERLATLLPRLKDIEPLAEATPGEQRESSAEPLNRAMSHLSEELKVSRQIHELFSSYPLEEALTKLPNKEGLNQPSTVRYLCKLARDYYESDLNQAEAIISAAGAIADNLAVPTTPTGETITAVARADLLVGEGILAKQRGEYHAAIECFGAAAQDYMDADQEDYLTQALIPWAGVLMNLQEWGQSEQLYQASLAIAKQYGDVLAEGKAYYGLASMSLARGDFSDDPSYLAKAHRIFQELGETVLEAGTYVIEGYAYRERKDNEKALACFKKAGSLYQSANAIFELGRVQMNQAMVEYKLGMLPDDLGWMSEFPDESSAEGSRTLET